MFATDFPVMEVAVGTLDFDRVAVLRIPYSMLMELSFSPVRSPQEKMNVPYVSDCS